MFRIASSQKTQIARVTLTALSTIIVGFTIPICSAADFGSDPGLGGDSLTDRDFYGTLQAGQSATGSGTCSCPERLPATSYTRTIELSDTDGPLDLFEPLAARDMMVAVSNTGSADLELEFYEDGSSVPTYRTVPAGLSKSFTEAHVVDLFASCLGRGCNADVDIAFAPPSNENPGAGIDSLKAWFVPPTVEGSADSAPDGSPGVCLWDPDIVWESDESYDAHVYVKVDGDHNATVEVYYNGGAAIASYDLQSKAEAPNNDVYVEEHEDVTEVRVRCEKSVLADCGKCHYEYEITFLE